MGEGIDLYPHQVMSLRKRLVHIYIIPVYTKHEWVFFSEYYCETSTIQLIIPRVMGW